MNNPNNVYDDDDDDVTFSVSFVRSCVGFLCLLRWFLFLMYSIRCATLEYRFIYTKEVESIFCCWRDGFSLLTHLI